MERRKERGRKIIQIEKEELTRREDEVHVLRGEFDKVRKKNEEAEEKSAPEPQSAPHYGEPKAPQHQAVPQPLPGTATSA